MADQRNGGITWTEETWNPLRGCTRVSAGCMNCYAETMAARFCGAEQPYEGTINPETKRWNGTVKLVHDKLSEPLRWSRPRMVFVNSMSDLFHEDVPFEFIDEVFAVMALSHKHTFQVLTKRPDRMLNYLSSSSVRDKWAHAGDTISYTMEPLHYANISHIGEPGNKVSVFTQWPLPNVWLGVTVENQEAADERIPPLINTPAAVRWLSCEPLLGKVDLFKYVDPHVVIPALLDWVVVGGESGKGARPMHPEWAASLRNQCDEAGVPFLFKQWGEWVPNMSLTHSQHVANSARDDVYVRLNGTTHWIDRDDHEQFNASDMLMSRIGKKSAGRMLDGKLHDGYPKTKP